MKEWLGRLGVTIEKLIERNGGEAIRREGENSYRALFENLSHKIVLKDRDSVYLSCNKSCARDLGLDAHRIAGMTDDDFYPPELAAKFRAADRRVLESGSAEEFDQEYGRNSNNVVAHTVKIPVRGSDGNVIGILEVLWDNTERKRAEEALQHSEERYRRLFETAQDGSRPELLGQKPSILKSNRHDIKYYQDLWATILAGKAWHGELVKRRKNGAFVHGRDDDYASSQRPRRDHEFHCY